MAVSILRPDAPGTHNTAWSIFTTSGFTTYWENIDEPDADGDSNYVYTTEPGSFTVSFSDYSSSSYIRPARVAGIVVIATLKTSSANPIDFQFRLRHLGVDYDSEVFTVNAFPNYVEVYKIYKQTPTGDGWNAASLGNLEVGLVYGTGVPTVELRCTKLEVQVQTELYPQFSLTPDNTGDHSEWSVEPTTASDHQVVDRFDGDLSYLYSNNVWQLQDTNTTEDLNSVFGLSTTDVIAVGDAGTILRWDGTDWSTETSGVTYDLHGVWASSTTDIFVVGMGGTALYWDGIAWNDISPATSDALRGVWGTSPTDVFVVGSSGTVLHWNGAAWSTMVSGTTEHLLDVWGLSSSEVYAVGANGEIIFYNGVGWAVQTSGTTEQLNGVYGSVTNDVYAVGENSAIVRWNGVSWGTVTLGVLADLNAVWTDATNNVVIVGDSGFVRRWDGAQWEELVTRATTDLYDVWGTTTSNVYSVGVGGVFTYVNTNTWWPITTVNCQDLPATLPAPVIDRVQASALIKNEEDDSTAYVSTVARSSGADYLGARGTLGWPVPSDDEWHFIEEEFLNDPNTGWPTGVPTATAWLGSEVNSLQVGVKNRGGDLRCTSMGLEVFLKNTPISTFDMVPVADGYHAQIPPRQPNTGESAWEDVDDNPPDWSGSYIGADASTTGTTQYATFSMAAGGPVPAGEQIYCVELRIGARLGGATEEAWIAGLIRNGGETYVGRPFRVNNTGTTWFYVKEDFFTSPFTGERWDLADVNASEWGVVILSGDADITSVKAQVQTAPLLSGTPDASDLQITFAGTNLMSQSKIDGTNYAVLEFGVGTGGYVPTDPGTITPVSPLAISLVNEIYRDRIEAVTYDADGPPWTVDYWCRVPREEAVEAIGEIGLYAQIISSPSYPVGSWILFAIMHFPAQCRHDKNVHLHKVSVEYP